MKKRKRFIKIILTSINIILVCSAIGIVFNIINPLGIEFKLKSTQQVLRVITIYKTVPQKKPVDIKTIKVSMQDSKTTKISTGNLPPIQPIVEQVDLKRAKELFDEGKVIFLDTRPEFKYIEEHIKGAFSLSASRFNLQYEQVKDKIKKDDVLITYCSSVTCHLNEMVANNLKEKGFTNLKIFTGGWNSWKGAGFPTEKGNKP
ncbi:MAG: rhodanese-like domain-containing protein [Candidatus Firestonebacteria bacterium]